METKEGGRSKDILAYLLNLPYTRYLSFTLPIFVVAIVLVEL